MGTTSLSRHSIAWAAGLVLLGALGVAVLAYLYAHVVASDSFALMHLLTELIRIVVAVAAFMVVWNTRDSIDNGYIVIVAVAGLCVAGLDLAHALLYRGIDLVFTTDADLAYQLRLIARDLQAASLLVAARYAGRRVSAPRVLIGFGAVTAALVAASAWLQLFPLAFTERTGPTTFAVANEYAIAAVMLVALVALARKRDAFDPAFFWAMSAAIAAFIAAELAYARFSQPSSFANYLGHLMSVAGAILVYRGMVIEAVARPFDVLFTEFSSTLTELERSEQRFRSTFDQATLGILELDESNHVVRANPRARELTCHGGQEIIGLPAEELTHPADRTAEAQLFAALSDGEVNEYRLEKRVLCNDGPIAWVSASRSAVRDEAGDIRYYLEMLEDITSRKHAEAVLARARDLKSALLAIDVAINSTFAVDEILGAAVPEAARALGADSAVVMMLDRKEWQLQTVWQQAEAAGSTLTADDIAEMIRADLEGLPLAIEDTESDERVNAAVSRRLGIRSLVVIPLAFRGERLGLLLFSYNSSQRRFSEDEIGFVIELSSALTLAIENSRLYEAERRTVDTLQESLLRIETDVPGIDVGTAYYSAVSLARLGGDFFDVFALSDDRVAFVVGDVAGKGIEAAAITAIAKSTVRAFAYEWGTPARVVRATNQALMRQLDDGRFVTLVYGLLDLHTGETRIVCAGHPSPLICDASGCVADVSVHNPPLAVFDTMDFEEFRTVLDPNMRLIAFSDGLLDARKGEEFLGEERVRDMVDAMGDADPDRLVADLLAAAQAHSDGHPPDDIAILALRYTGLDGTA